MFAWLHPAAFDQRQPPGKARIDHGGGHGIAQGHGHRHGQAGGCTLGHGPIWAARRHEVDAAATLQFADAIEARHDRQAPGTGIVLTRSDEAFELFDRRCADMDQLLARLDVRFGKLRISGRLPQYVEYSRLHLPFSGNGMNS